MRTHVGVGMSDHRDPRRAGKQAARTAMEAANCDRPAFAFVFATVGYAQQVLMQAIREEIGHAPLCGCTGEGVIAGPVAQESSFCVGVMVIGAGGLTFPHGLATGLRADSEAAGRQVGRSLAGCLSDDTGALFVFGDGLSMNFDAFMRGLHGVIGPEVRLPVLGGLAADNWAFRQTFQYCDDAVVSDGVAWALLRGDAQVHSSVNHGCVPIGGRRRITRAAGNVVYEIDGRPALDVLKEYLLPEEIDNWDKAVISLCLGFKTPAHIEGYSDYVIRFIPARDEADGSISIQTEVPEDGEVWMTRRDPARMAEGANRVAEDIQSRAGGRQPLFVLQFDCCGRGSVILDEGARMGMLHEMQRRVGADTPWLGFYTLGEIGPVGSHNCFHNYTVVLTGVYDAVPQ